MKRHTVVALLAFLVSIPLAQAVQSSIHALGSAGPGAWMTAVGDAVMAGLALSCAIALIALLDERPSRNRMVALLDWRATLRARRLERSHSGAAVRARV